MFTQLAEENGWTEQDALQWFDYHFTQWSISDFYLVLHHFDECPRDSRKVFFDWLSRRFGGREVLWKIFITSLVPGSLTDELIQAQSVDLQKSQNGVISDYEGERMQKTLSQYVSDNPNRSLESLERELDAISRDDSLTRAILVDQLAHRKDWHGETLSLKGFLGLETDRHLVDELLETILGSIFRQVPHPFPTKLLLKWLLYSARPLTVWELCMMIGLDSRQATDSAPVITSDSIRAFKQMCEEWLSGIVDLRRNQVTLRHPRLKAIFTRPRQPGRPQFLWNEIRDSEAEYDITRVCLQFLALTTIQGMLESIFDPATVLSCSEDLTGLCAYAVHKWPQHYASIPVDLNPSVLLEEYTASALTPAWAKAHWHLDNPITRPKKAWKSFYPLLVSLGLPTPTVEREDSRSMAQALCEAAKSGRSTIAHELLDSCQDSRSTLVDALVSAASGGQENLMLSILHRIREHHEHGSGPAELPPSLIYRASWLGLDRVLKDLLEDGCSPAPGGPMTGEPFMTKPLFPAVRFAHVEAIKVLLKHGPDTKRTTLWGSLVLHHSIYCGLDEVPRILVESGRVNISSLNNNGCTTLDVAAGQGYTKATKCLLQLGADPYSGKDIKDPKGPGWLPLVAAAAGGMSECVRILIEGGADPNQCGPRGSVRRILFFSFGPALEYSSIPHSFQLGPISICILSDGLTLRIMKNTALLYAAVNNFPDTCRTLLENGADPNHPSIQPPTLAVIISQPRASFKTSDKLQLLAMMASFGALVDAPNRIGGTALMLASQLGEEELAQCLLQLGANVNICNSYGQSALYIAAGNNQEPIARLLLEKGADPNTVCKAGSTALILAAQKGFVNTVRVLLGYKAQVNITLGKDQGLWSGWSAALIAAKNGHAEILQMLIDAGASLSQETFLSKFLPINVVEDVETLKVLFLHRKRFDMDHQNVYGNTRLHRGADNEEANHEIFKRIINSGANVNIQNKHGFTPLSLAALAGAQAIVRLLLGEEDIDLNLASARWGGPLQIAARDSNLEVLNMLVKAGADPNRSGNSFCYGTPLQMACMERKPQCGKEMVEYLLENGADVAARGGSLGSALSAAAFRGSPELLSLLLDRGASTNVFDKIDRMPIHFSTRDYDRFQLVLKAGGNIKAKDKMGRTVLHWAAMGGQPRVIEYILAELGSTIVDEPDLDGWTSLMWAARAYYRDTDSSLDHEELVRVLLRHGAIRSVRGMVGEQTWSLQRVAVYSGASTHLLKLLQFGLDNESGNNWISGTDDDTLRVAHKKDFWCNICYWVSSGTLFLYPSFHLIDNMFSKLSSSS